MATLGTLILWLGWFGFNGGSELKISNIEEANAVAMVFVNTNTAAAGGLVAALMLSRAWFGKADLTMALNGALAGLVAITAEPLTPTPLVATSLGQLVVCWLWRRLSLSTKQKSTIRSVLSLSTVSVESGDCWLLHLLIRKDHL